MTTLAPQPADPSGFADEPEPTPEPIPKQKTSLQLTPERLAWLIGRAMQRISEVSLEVGRNEDGTVQPGSWLAERIQNQQTDNCDLDWRAVPGTVFAEGSNLTWGDNSRRVRNLSASSRNSLMGSRPFFGCMTGRSGNPKLTKQAEAYLQERIEESNVPATNREAIHTALVRNEAVIKTTYFVDRTPFVGPALGVFVDVATGEPLRTSKGELIYSLDDMLPDPHTEGLGRLKKDPSFAFRPEALDPQSGEKAGNYTSGEASGQYQATDFDSIPQVLTHYDNVHAEVVDTRDFLCPLKVNDIRRADINAHLYHQSFEQLKGGYGDLDTEGRYFGRSKSRTGLEQPIRAMGEEEEVSSNILPKILVAEVYIRCDADGDGREEEIWLILDMDNKQAIFYDYLGNHMSQRPFAVLTGVEKVAGRWYGVGVYTKMAHSELFADAMYNRANLKCSRVASVTVADRRVVTEWAAGGVIELGTEKILSRSPNSDPNIPPIQRYNMMENMEPDMSLASSARQAGDTLFGIQSGQSASMMDLNQSKTATGIMSIERDANDIRHDMLIDMTAGLEMQLSQSVEMILENMDLVTLAYSADGSELATLNRDEIRAMEKRVKLLLTKSKSAELMTMNSQAEAVWMRFRKLTPPDQMVGRPLYLNQLKALGVDDADSLLPEVTPEKAAAWETAQAQRQEPPKPPSKNIATKYGELARSEQVQVLQQENIQPASDEELAANQAGKVAAERAEKAPFPQERVGENTASS